MPGTIERSVVPSRQVTEDDMLCPIIPRWGAAQRHNRDSCRQIESKQLPYPSGKSKPCPKLSNELTSVEFEIINVNACRASIGGSETFGLD
jgi:hypothetical protein